MNKKTDNTGSGAPKAPASFALTMSTFEVAGLTGKRHADVLRDARKMLKELAIPERKFAFSYKGDNGRDQPLLKLPKRETLILVSGYSTEMRARIIDRWMELEAIVAATEHDGLSPEESVREFGMIKSLVRDLTDLRRQIVTLHEESLAARRLANGVVSTIEYKYAIRVAEEHGIPQRGRGRLVAHIGKSLLRFCREQGAAYRDEYREDGISRRRLFHVNAIAAWLRAEGHAMIAAHLAGRPFARQPEGQGVLHLVGKVKP